MRPTFWQGSQINASQEYSEFDLCFCGSYSAEQFPRYIFNEAGELPSAKFYKRCLQSECTLLNRQFICLHRKSCITSRKCKMQHIKSQGLDTMLYFGFRFTLLSFFWTIRSFPSIQSLLVLNENLSLIAMHG